MLCVFCLIILECVVSLIFLKIIINLLTIKSGVLRFNIQVLKFLLKVKSIYHWYIAYR